MPGRVFRTTSPFDLAAVLGVSADPNANERPRTKKGRASCDARP